MSGKGDGMSVIALTRNGTGLRKLDVGAGAIREEGYETMDISPAFSPDFQHDLTQLPWPFADQTFDEVKCFHVLEHLERKYLVPVMNEMHRILKPEGRAMIEVPLFPYWPAIADPTHVSFFVIQTFAYFCTGESYQRAAHGARAFEDYHDHRKLYGINEWEMIAAKRDGMGSIVRVELKPCA